MSEFARATGLTVDTVRFYVRRGLLNPEVGTKGGRNPHQIFTDEHVGTAQLIRIGQALGLSLGAIGALLRDAREGRFTPERMLATARDQRDRLRRRARELQAMADYMDAKVAWLEAGATGPQPDFVACAERTFHATPDVGQSSGRSAP